MTSVGLKACVLACVFVVIALAQSVSIPPNGPFESQRNAASGQVELYGD